jgi:hypothetical protein
MTLDASGNLGVGTTSPSQRLHVSNASGGSNILVANGTNSASNIYVATDGFAATTGSIYTNGSAPLAFGTNSTERARIDSSGSFMVGNTSVSNTVAGFYTSLNGTIIVHTNSSSFSQPLLLNRENSDGDAIVFRRANSTVGSISVTTTATAYNTSSDYRLKNITGALTGYKERLMSLLPKQGTWIIDGSEFRGFVAHEFATPYRASVTGEKDAVDADGNPIMQSMQASSSEVMADLVALVQEQQAIIESLKARLDAANL